MEARPYEPKDFEQVQKWAAQYGSEIREHQYPKTGFIIDGFGAYFLYSTDSSCCWLENLIANKEAEPGLKGLAIEILTAAILNKAKELGFKVAYATTDNMSVVARARQHGATITPLQILLTKDLEGHHEDAQGE